MSTKQACEIIVGFLNISHKTLQRDCFKILYLLLIEQSDWLYLTLRFMSTDFLQAMPER